MFSTRVRLASIFALIIAALVFSAVKFGRVSEANTNAPMAVSVAATEAVVEVAGTVDGNADPGDTLEYTVTITNSGSTDATNVQLDSTIDPVTGTLVAGSTNIGPIGGNDTYNTIGNVNLAIPTGAGSLLSNDSNPDGAAPTLTGFGNTLGTANANLPGATIASTNGGSLTVNADGSFNYNPPVAGTATETFFYTISDGALTNTASVTINIAGKIWFVKVGAAGGGDGRLATPFNCLTGAGCFSAVNDGGLNHPAAGDYIFLYGVAPPAPLTGGVTLLNNQRLIGEGALASILTITGFTTPSGTNQLPATGNAAPVITTVSAGTNGVNLAVGASATLRGFNIGNTTGFKIASGANFGTLTASEMTLNGTGGDLSLTSGALAATFASITSTGSAATQGIALSSVSGNMTVTGGTTITNPTTQGILVTGSTATISFGNTSISGGTNQISLQNNSAGTRTFGSLTLAAGTGAGNPAFLHSNGGGTTTAGATFVNGPAGTGIDIQSSTTLVTFGTTTVSKSGSAGIGVNLGGVGTGNSGGVTFGSLDITTSNGSALVGAENSGTITVSSGGIISATSGAAINITKTTTTTPIALSLSSVSSTGGTQGINLLRVSGTLTATGGSLSGATGSTFKVDTSTASITYPGTITQAAAGQRVVDIQNGTAGTIALSGQVTSTSGPGTGVIINNDAGVTTNFTGGLALSTAGNDAFTATTGGTISATQNNTTIVNTLSTTSGQALKVTSTTIGGGGLTFRSIASGAGANNGITLDTTGAGAGLTVTGNGTTNSGGVISGKTGGDGSSTSGIGIYLNSTAPVSLTRMDIEGCQNYGIRGNTVAGFVIDNSTVGTTSTNGTSNTADTDATGYSGEGSIRFYNLTGSATMSNSSFDQGFAKTIAVVNDTGSLNRLTISNSTVKQSLIAATASDSLFAQSSNNATLNLTVNGASQFTATHQFHIDTNAQGTSTMDIQITGACVFSNSINPVPAGGGLQMGSSGTDSLVTFNINGNSFRHGIGASSPGINNVGRLITAGTVSGNGKFDGKIVGNTFGVTGIPRTGSGDGADAIGLFASGNKAGTTRGTGTLDSRFLVQNNSIKRYGETGVLVNARQGNSILDATIIGNTINEPGTAALGAFAAIWVNAGALAGDSNRVDIVIGSAGTAADKNTMQDSDPSNATDVFIDRSSCAGCASVLNLYRNGSGAAAGQSEPIDKQILIDDNNATLDLLGGFTNGGGTTIGTPAGTPPQPALPPPPPAGEKAFGWNAGEFDKFGLIGGSYGSPVAQLELKGIVMPSVPVTDSGTTVEIAASASAELPASENAGRDSYLASIRTFATGAADLAGEVTSRIGESISPTVEAQDRGAVKPRKGQPQPEAGGVVSTTPQFTLFANSSIKITYRVTVNNGPYASGVNSVNNVAAISGSNFGTVNATPNPTTIALDVAPDLSVTTSDALGTAQPGVTVTYNVNYANATGPTLQDAAGATLTATLPANTTLNVAGSPGWTCVAANCTKVVGGPIVAGSNTSVPFAVDVAAALPQTALTLVTTSTVAENPVNANGTDQNGGNNSGSDTDNMVGVWLGGTSTDWNVAANWSNALQPATPQNISVPAGAGNAPAVINPNVTVNGLVLNGKDLTIGAGRTVLANSSAVLGTNNVLGTGTLELASGAPITRTTGQVNCSLKKNFVLGNIAPESPQAVFVFPVGTATGYSPLSANVSATSTGSLTVLASNGTAVGTPAINPATSLNRFWTLAETGNITADLTFTYLPADVNGIEANYKLMRVAAGGVRTAFPNGVPCPGGGSPCVNPATHTIFVAGVTVFEQFWTAGESVTTAANVNVSGRVLTPDGRGLAGARVEMVDPTTREVVYAMTNNFGYYHFINVAAGQEYVMGVADKRYTFETRLVNVSNELTDLDFIAKP